MCGFRLCRFFQQKFHFFAQKWLFEDFEFVENVSFQMLNAVHEIEFEIGLRRQLFHCRQEMSPVGEHCAVEIDAMKCTKLNEPSDVVDVLRWNDCKCQKNYLAVAKFGADASHLPVVLRTVEMTEVDKQNRNVHAVPQACNWQANEQPVEMWRKARFGLCALQSYGNRVKVLVATAVVPNELAKEIRELMVTTLNVCNVELHQKVESLWLVIGGAAAIFCQVSFQI